MGLGEPFWYVGGVKLMFCAFSLLIPVGMYFFARRHFGELSARVALLAGAFWYELVGFAHKPMTEFVATALLMALLVLCVRSSVDRVADGLAGGAGGGADGGGARCSTRRLRCCCWVCFFSGRRRRFISRLLRVCFCWRWGCLMQ